MRSLCDVRAIVAGSAVAAVLTGCASIWGFEAAVDLTEAGPDATNDATNDAMVGTMGMPSDAAADASFASDAAGPCTCMPAPPTNWGGPFAIYESAGSLPALPNCVSAGVYSTEVYAGTGSLDAGPAECTCACDPVSATCGPAVMSFFSDGMCTQACSPATQAIGSTCSVLNVNGCGGVNFTVKGGTPSGSCAPDASTTLPAPKWQASVRLCGLAQAAPVSACNSAQVCAPMTGFPFESVYCVAQAGAVSCPSEYPAERPTYYASYDDSRGCGACTCAPPTGIACSPTVSMFGSPNCTGGAMPQPQACSGAGGTKSAMTTGNAATGGSCAPSGGQATGTVSPSTPTTVCCTR